MVKIYIGIEDGIIGAVYCNQDAELCIVSLDRDSHFKTLVREENLLTTSSNDIIEFIKQAKQEESKCIEDWNDYQLMEEI